MTSSKDRTCKQFRDKPPGPPGARDLFTPLVQAGRHTSLRSNTAIIFWSASLTEVGLILGLFLLSWEIVESSKQVMQMLESVRTDLMLNYIVATVIMEEESLDTTDFIWPPMGLILLWTRRIRGQAKKKVSPYFPFVPLRNRSGHWSLILGESRRMYGMIKKTLWLAAVLRDSKYTQIHVL
jgi:hypothetical protein